MIIDVNDYKICSLSIHFWKNKYMQNKIEISNILMVKLEGKKMIIYQVEHSKGKERSLCYIQFNIFETF